MTLTAVLLLGLLPGQPPANRGAGPEPIPPRIARFLEQCETTRRGAIAQLEFELRGLRSGAIAPDSTHQIAQLEASLSKLKANQELVVPPLSFPPAIGDIGRLPGDNCHVEQIWNEREMLVRCVFPVVVNTRERRQQVMERIERPRYLLLRGLDTATYRAGADVGVSQVFEIKARHTYRTESGQDNTVLVLEPFDLARAAALRSPH